MTGTLIAPDDLNRRMNARLYDLGYFAHHLMYREGQELLRDEAIALPAGDKLQNQAVLLFQDFNEAAGNVDGVFGPKTRHSLFDTKRCDCPDFGIRIEGGVVVAEAKGPHAAAADTGSGFWPANCYEEFPGRHSISYSWDHRRRPSHITPHWDTIWQQVQAIFADVGMGLVEREDIDRGNFQSEWENLSGSTIGLAIVGWRGIGCGDKIWQKITTDYRPSQLIDSIVRLIVHEWLHSFGFQHERSGIMAPSLSLSTPTNIRLDPIWNKWKQRYGDQPLAPDPAGPDHVESITFVSRQGRREERHITTDLPWSDRYSFLGL